MMSEMPQFDYDVLYDIVSDLPTGRSVSLPTTGNYLLQATNYLLQVN